MNLPRRVLGSLLIAVPALLATPAAHGQSTQRALATLVQTQVRYLAFFPKSYTGTGDPVPLIVFLHGSGERGNDLEKVKAWGPPALVEKDPAFPMMVISPQAPEGEAWDAGLLRAMLDDVLARYNVDRQRVYLTGLSMGGYGAWELAMRHPEYFAAIAPIAGGGDPRRAPRLKGLPVWAFHGKKDDAVPESESARMVEAVLAAGGEVKYSVLPEGGHVDAWVYAYEKAGLFNWFLQHRRP